MPLNSNAIMAGLRPAGRPLIVRLVGISLCCGMGWFAYQLAGEISSDNGTFQESPTATIAFLALAFAVAAYVALRQQARAAEGSREQTARGQAAELGQRGLLFAIEQAWDAVAIADRDGTIEYVNRAFTALTGYSAEDVLGCHARLAKSGLSWACEQRVWDAIGGGQVWRGEIANQRKDGSPYREEVTVAPVRGGDGVIRKYIAVGRDATQRRLAQHTQALLASIVDAADDAILGVARDGSILSWNQGAERIYGYRAEEMVGQPLAALAAAGRGGEFAQALERVHRGETVSQWETVTANRAGATVEVSFTMSPVRDGAGAVIGLSAVARDLGRQRSGEEALRRSEARYQALVANLPDVVWVADEPGQAVFVSPNCQALTGYTPAEISRPDFWAECIHPEDLQRLWAAHRALFAEGRPLDAEFRFRRKDGKWIWLHDRAAGTYERGGKRYRDGLVSDITERKDLEGKLAHQATHDLLTGLPNRAAFEDRFRQALARARRQGSMAALLYLDLDRFKRINDTLGQRAGDALIRLAAERLTACLRESETISRSGGDRFTAILSDIGDPREAVKVAERILAALAAPFPVKGSEVFLTASIGIAMYPRDGQDPLVLQRAADSALYAAKRQGKHGIQMSTPEIRQAATRRMAVETELHYALERGELTVHYQPQFDLATDRIAGVEALVRWKNPKFGCVPASVLIPIAEESGLIVPLGVHVLRETCRQARRWRDAGHRPIQVAVNVSGVQFGRGDLPKTVAAVLAETGLEASLLDLEVTESVIMQDLQETARQLRELKKLGVSVSLDDFGTGYSSLSYLEELPIDNLKIDRKFIQRMHGADSTRTLVESIVGLAHGLGMRAVAEGVETPEQLVQLQGMGCDRAQSFMLGGPVPASSIGKLLEQAAGRDPSRAVA